MSDMIINDSVPVDKKWNELIKYNIFIMKLVEFVISLLLMIVPFILLEPSGFHCLAVAPTLMLSIMFIVLYLVDQVHDMAEQLYLVIQITIVVLNIFAVMAKPSPVSAVYGLFYMHILIAMGIDLYYVLSLLLNLMPHAVEPVDVMHCLVAAPTLMLSTQMMVLYLVDQVQHEAEFYYLIIQAVITVLAFFNLFIVGKLRGAIYGLFYLDLLIAYAIDFNNIYKERGLTY